MKNYFKAGWAYRSLTPFGRSVSLAGQYYERITDEVDCELMVAAFSMASPDTRLIWITCDVVGITDKLLNAVKGSLKAVRPDIDTNNLIMSAIHTHNAPFVKYGNVLGRSGYFRAGEGLMSDMEYHEFIVKRITEAVIESSDKMEEGYTLKSAVLNIRTGCCRRGILKNGNGVMYIDTSRDDFMRMEGPDGGPVNVLYIEDRDMVVKGVIACIPCTAQVMEHQFCMSSDYTGRIREMLQNEYGDDFLFLPLISAAGDLSPRNLMTGDYGLGDMYGADGADLMADRIFKAIKNKSSNIENTSIDASALVVQKKNIRLPGWVPSEEDYEWAKTVISSKDAEYNLDDYVQKGVEPYYMQPLALAKKAESIIEKFENFSDYEYVDIEVTAVRMDGIVIVTNPFELFIEHGNRISAGSMGESVWPVQLVNGYKGYFPTKEAVVAGGYSAYIQSVRVAPEKAADILVDESISLIEELFE